MNFNKQEILAKCRFFSDDGTLDRLWEIGNSGLGRVWASGTYLLKYGKGHEADSDEKLEWFRTLNNFLIRKTI